MKLNHVASHIFSATLLLVGVALVVGACSSKSGTDQPKPTADGAASKRADGEGQRPPVLMAVEATDPQAVSPAAEAGQIPQQQKVAQISRSDDETSVAETLAAESRAADLPPADKFVAEAPTSETLQPVGLEVTSEPGGKDPTEEKLFEGWDDPRATLFITGRQEGYIEPCGCTGLTNQKGGLNRKYTLMKQLREKGWNPVGLDAGNQVRRFGRQAEIKFRATIDGFRKMGYKAIALGPDDLKLSFDELLSVVIPEGGDPAARLFVCANVDLLEMNAPYLVIESGGKKIGVTAILGEEFLDKVTAGEITKIAPHPALAEVWPKLQAAECDVYVLLAHTSIDESKRLAREFPGFQVVVTAGGMGEFPSRPDMVNGGKTMLVQIGTKGMYVGVIGLFDDPARPLRYQKVTLDARFPDAQPMLDLMKEYQLQLEAATFAGLELRPQPIASGHKYVGSTICADCHSIAYDIWKETPHAHATQTLVKPPERYQVSRHHDPECISCHVVGWEPQKYFPYVSGYESLDSDEGLHNVGCENCHGPGSKHVAAENGDIDATDEQIEAFRKQMVITLEQSEAHCKRCHDLDNSPDFHKPGAFDEYWEKVEHYGKD